MTAPRPSKVSALGIEEQRVRVYLDFVDHGSGLGSLGDSFRVYVRIVEWRGEDVLSSLFRSADVWTVFRAEADRARLTRVEVGRRNSEMAEVLAAEGDTIVNYPGDRASNGALPL